MTSKPPREGARWGEDPAPEPIPTEEPPSEYLDLCNQYGEANVQKTLAIFEAVKLDFPHLEVLKEGELHFASSILHNAKSAMENAAKDGRTHTMPETLEIFEKGVGQHLAKNPGPNSITTIALSYGDEHLGKQALQIKEGNRKKQDATAKKWIALLAIIMGIFAMNASRFEGYYPTASIIIGIIATVVSFPIFYAIYFIIADNNS